MSDLFKLLPAVEFHTGPWALVTLVGAEGSTYRKKGARLLVSRQGPLGMISGGCLEADIARRCAPILSGEEAAIEMNIDTRHLLGCDGRLILVAEALPASLVSGVCKAAELRRPAVVSTFSPGSLWQPTSVKNDPIPGAFHERLVPRRQLLVFGSTPGAQPLLDIGNVLEWQVQQVALMSDPRAYELNGRATILRNAAQTATLNLDPWTACVVMNHHMGRDLEILQSLWNSPAPYLGLLGSRQRRDKILEGLAFTSGSTEVDLGSRDLYAPVGLPLGGEGPTEIALEICAQIQQVLSCGLKTTGLVENKFPAPITHRP